jgi:hypothetical protein
MRSLKRHRQQHVVASMQQTTSMVTSALWLLSTMMMMMRQPTESSAFMMTTPCPTTKPPMILMPRKSHYYDWRLFALPEIKDMPLRDMRAELESYGISTRSFLEKREFLDALHKARQEGMTPINGSTNQANGSTSTSTSKTSDVKDKETTTTTTKTTTTSSTTAKNGTKQQQQTNTTPSSNKNSDTATATRQQRLNQELEKANAMRVGELRQELKDMGINTKAFFEKSEFVRAYAEAIVDGKTKDSSKTSSSTRAGVQDEPYDPEYRDVVMQKFDAQAKPGFLLSGTIIDVDLLQ